ncbi:hypothetical protein [Algoriphagus sp.]|uniref:hypothetical protein n=1 Tax=Algoriphagus sp. TaxID=1872435 RepID=UPI003F700333
MKNFPIQTSTFILGAIVLASCSTNKLATTGVDDNLYFMASDARVATEYAVQNNNPQQFQSLSSSTTEAVPQESFSSRNVNPDYLARYQAEEPTSQDEIVYFDEGGNEESTADINAYDNYRVGNNGNNSNFNNSMAFNMGMMYGMGAWGMNPWMSPWGMGGFYSPWGYGFRPGFSMNIGFGFGSPWMMRPGMGYGMGYGIYDPFWGPGYGFGGYPMYGYRPIYVLPGGEYGDRRIATGSRLTRGSSLAATRGTGSYNRALEPSTARAQARRDVVNRNGTAASSRRLVSNSDNSRVSARDFSTSQNDYYSRSRTENARNVNSAALERPVSRTRSAMPSARPTVNPSNSRTINTGRGSSVRSSYPSNSRSASPSYNRSNVPTRNAAPSYNRGNTNTRTITPSRSTAPTRSTPTYRSAPSRSSSPAGGASRSSGGASRGGRGN